MRTKSNIYETETSNKSNLFFGDTMDWILEYLIEYAILYRILTEKLLKLKVCVWVCVCTFWFFFVFHSTVISVLIFCVANFLPESKCWFCSRLHFADIKTKCNAMHRLEERAHTTDVKCSLYLHFITSRPMF